MGFPDNFVIPVSDTQAYRQFGNSIVVPVVRAVAGLMVPVVQEMVGNNPTQAASGVRG
jgi:DNA (cytosine-5)-methyltransferase 1